MAKPEKTAAASEPTKSPVLRIEGGIESNLAAATLAELALFGMGGAGDEDVIVHLVGALHEEAGTTARLLEADRETLWLSGPWFAMERKLAVVGELLRRERALERPGSVGAEAGPAWPSRPRL